MRQVSGDACDGVGGMLLQFGSAVMRINDRDSDLDVIAVVSEDITESDFSSTLSNESQGSPVEGVCGCRHSPVLAVVGNRYMVATELGWVWCAVLHELLLWWWWWLLLWHCSGVLSKLYAGGHSQPSQGRDEGCAVPQQASDAQVRAAGSVV